jgi:hypothetical protein
VVSVLHPESDSTPDIPSECICTGWCPEDFGDEHYCRYCGGLDIYDPCPRVGFGCGANGNTDRCDCCSDEEWASAGGAA